LLGVPPEPALLTPWVAILSTPGEIGVLLALIVLNGLLAGAEIAIVSMRSSRIDELADKGSSAAAALRRLRADPERFLATVQVGITLVGVSAGAFGGASFGEDLGSVLARFEPIRPYAQELAFALVVALITYLSLILGELVPKSMAMRRPEGYALLVARPLELLAGAARPAVWLLTGSSNAVLRLFGDRTDFLEARLSMEELRSLVDQASRAGEVHPGAGAIASRALELTELRVADVMVHRRFLVALPIDAPPAALRAAFLESGHRRVPVYQDRIDNVLGYVSWRDVLQRVLEGSPLVVRDMVRSAHLVPESADATDLLLELLRRKQQIAVVLDEHGGLAGIVTLEDLLEELVGEIESEHGRPTQRIRRESDGTATVQGDATLRDVNRDLELELDEPEDGTTLNALVVELAGGRIPAAGEAFEASDGTRVEVLEASPRRVRRVRLVPARGDG
jgi:putative hemolysin